MTQSVRDRDRLSVYVSVMVKRIRRRPKAPLYIKEWINYRGLSVPAVAEKLDIAAESLHRQIREQNRLNPLKIAELAIILDIEPWELWRPPGQVDLNAIVADFDDDIRARAAELVRLLVRRPS